MRREWGSLDVEVDGIAWAIAGASHVVQVLDRRLAPAVQCGTVLMTHTACRGGDSLEAENVTSELVDKGRLCPRISGFLNCQL